MATTSCGLISPSSIRFLTPEGARRADAGSGSRRLTPGRSLSRFPRAGRRSRAASSGQAGARRGRVPSSPPRRGLPARLSSSRACTDLQRGFAAPRWTWMRPSRCEERCVSAAACPARAGGAESPACWPSLRSSVPIRARSARRESLPCSSTRPRACDRIAIRRGLAALGAREAGRRRGPLRAPGGDRRLPRPGALRRGDGLGPLARLRTLAASRLSVV